MVTFPRPPAQRDIFDPGADKCDRAAVPGYVLQCELIYEAFDVELPQHKFLGGLVVTDKAHVLVRFALWVLLLRRIGRFVQNLNEAVVHNELVFTLGLARARLAVDVAFAFSNQGAERLPRICLFSGFRQLGSKHSEDSAATKH